MGAKIAGGHPSGPYPTLFYQRVMAQLDLINNLAPTSQPSSIAASSPTASQTEGRLERTGQDPTSQVGNDKGINGSISTLTNIFQATAKPSPIVFNMNGK